MDIQGRDRQILILRVPRVRCEVDRGVPVTQHESSGDTYSIPYG